MSKSNREIAEELAQPSYDHKEWVDQIEQALNDAEERGRTGTSEEDEQPEHEHVWRLNKHGRICVLCMKIEEGKSPYEGRTKK